MRRFEFSAKCGILAWNWRDTFGGRPGDVAALQSRIELDWCAIKLLDGPEPYNSTAERASLHGLICRAGFRQFGGWGYYYLSEVDLEIEATLNEIRASRPAFWLFDVEEPVSYGNTAYQGDQVALLTAIRREYPRLPLGLVTHAQPVYHPEIAYHDAYDLGVIIMPMAYHTAIGIRPGEVVDITMRQLALAGIPATSVVPGEGLYDTSYYQAYWDEVAAWGDAVVAAGCPGYWYWSLGSLLDRPDLERGIIASPPPPGWRANG